MAKRVASTRRSPRSPINDSGGGCTTHPPPQSGSVKVGSGAHASGVDPDLKAANLKHLRRIEGQVRGIAGMIEQDRYCADIIQQTAAVQESLRSVAKSLLRSHLKHCAAEAMMEHGTRRDEMIDEILALVAKIAR